MSIQWYPGHMHRAGKIIRSNISKVDVIIEVLDSRVPMSSSNPLIEQYAGLKPRLIILNKKDLSDPKLTSSWENYYRSKKIKVLAVSSIQKKTLESIYSTLKPLFLEKKWFKRRPVRALIMGIPNVGKSTLINGLAGNKKAGVANTPGFTREVVRYDTRYPLQIFDSPGILWPKIEDPQIGVKLAIVGSIRDSILSMEEIASFLLSYCQRFYKDCLANRYGVDISEDVETLLQSIAKKRAALRPGGIPDTEKAAFIIVKDLREGRLGRISLEVPDQTQS